MRRRQRRRCPDWMRSGVQKPRSCRHRLHSDAAAILRPSLKVTSSAKQRHDKRRDKRDGGESCDPFYDLDPFGSAHRTPPSVRPLKTKRSASRMVALIPEHQRKSVPSHVSPCCLGGSVCPMGKERPRRAGFCLNNGGPSAARSCSWFSLLSWLERIEHEFEATGRHSRGMFHLQSKITGCRSQLSCAGMAVIRLKGIASPSRGRYWGRLLPLECACRAFTAYT